MTANGMPAGVAVGYVMTDYPKLSMTFINDEIAEVRRLGGRIVTFAINRPGPGDLRESWAQRESQRTTYLKSYGALRLLSAVAAAAWAHPAGVARVIVMALRSAGTDPSLAVRRLVHVAYAAVVWRRCRDEGIHHLHAHFGHPTATITWFAAALGNLDPGERWTWSFTVHGIHDFFDRRVARLDLKAPAADFVVGISHFTRSQVCLQTPPECWDRLHVVRCGISTATFPVRAERALGDPPVVVAVGRLSPEKGHTVLLDAAGLLRERGLSVRVQIIGSGPYESAIRAASADLGIAVDLPGELPPAEVSRRLAGADVFCLPSFAEGLPISIMEAMAVGVPVVASNVGGIPELAVDGTTALTVPPSDPVALADALQVLLTDDDVREQLVAAARVAVLEAHQLTTNVADLVALFAEHQDDELVEQDRDRKIGVPS